METGVKKSRLEGKKNQEKKHLDQKNPAAEDASYEWQADINDAYEDLMQKRGDVIPSMSELLSDVEIIDKTLNPGESSRSAAVGKANQELNNDEHEDSSFDSMIERQIRELENDEDDTPIQSRKPIFSDNSNSKNSKQSEQEYEESFASQQEAAELRQEYTALATRMTNLEATLEGLVSERKHLPDHLARLNVSITNQFTLMNEKLNAAIESGIPSDSAQQISDQVTEMSSSSTKILETVHDDLTKTPNKLSQVSQTKPITGKKKRVRLLE